MITVLNDVFEVLDAHASEGVAFPLRYFLYTRLFSGVRGTPASSESSCLILDALVVSFLGQPVRLL